MNKSNYILIGILFLSLISFISATEISLSETQVYYFYRPGCSHCVNVVKSGILDTADNLSGVSVTKLNLLNQNSRDQFDYFASGFNIPALGRGLPFLVIEKNNKYSYLKGDTPIINNLENSIENFQAMQFSENGTKSKLTLWTVIIAALIDSINPCAFGVLIFLMISLLKIGSAKRALKAGLVYTAVVFVVYFLAGFGIFKVIQAFTSITHTIYLLAGILVLILGLWQFKDVFFPKIGPQLKISSKAKPIIEKMISKGTLPTMILLGIVVSLFELPCTGGIYLGILTLMSINQTFGIGYLLLYNLIFILPLLILTYIIYKGTSPEILQKWTSKGKKWMKIAAGIVLVALGIYILVF